MKKEKQHSHFRLPYPENLIALIGRLNLCENGQQGRLSEDQIQGLNYILDKLSELEREILRYRYEQYMPYEEIANVLNRPKESIITIHRKMIQKLRQPRWSIYYQKGYYSVLEDRRLTEEKRAAQIDVEIRQIEKQTGLILSVVKITDLNLSVRIVNALKYAGVFTLEDLVRWLIRNPKKAQRIHGLGEISWREIYDNLESYGIHDI